MSPDSRPVEHVAAGDHVGRKCPYCRFPLKSGIRAMECGACHAIHHLDCWQDNGGCTVMGCAWAPGKTPRLVVDPLAPGSLPPPPPPAIAPRQPGPSAADLAQALRSWVNTPTVTAVLTAALTALAAMVVVGLVVAVASPDVSQLGAAGFSGLFKEIARDIVATTQARFAPGYFQLLPITFALVPVLGSAVGMYRNASRLAGLPPRRRLLVGALTGVPLAVPVLIIASLGGASGEGFSAASVIFYCVLWGGIGGSAGAARALGSDADVAGVLFGDSWAARWIRVVVAAAKPLGIALLIAALVGVSVWEVQNIRKQANALSGRKQATAIAETPLFAGQYAIDDLALGTFTHFRLQGADSFYGPLPPNDRSNLRHFTPLYRVFAYRGSYPSYVYVFLLILLILVPVVFAVYAGFSSAVAAGARDIPTAVAWGALVGLVWAVIMAALRAIENSQLVVGASLFVWVLLIAGAAGALGGFLASLRTPAVATELT
jgi:hypothetical protein